MAVVGPARLCWLSIRRLPTPRRELVRSGDPDQPLPVVRVPRALQRRQELRQRRRQSSPQPALVRPGPLLLSARRPELNQPARLTLSRWESAPLASRGWKSRRARRDYFSIERAQHQAPALGKLAAARDTFADLGLEPRLLAALQQAAPDVVRPTTVQASAIPPLLRGRHVLCAAETGSGKTLSYFLPLLQRLLGRPNLHAAPLQVGQCLVSALEAILFSNLTSYGFHISKSTMISGIHPWPVASGSRHVPAPRRNPVGTSPWMWPPVLLHLGTTMSYIKGMERARWTGTGRHTAWSVPTVHMEISPCPPQQRKKQRSQRLNP